MYNNTHNNYVKWIVHEWLAIAILLPQHTQDKGIGASAQPWNTSMYMHDLLQVHSEGVARIINIC